MAVSAEFALDVFGQEAGGELGRRQVDGRQSCGGLFDVTALEQPQRFVID